MAESIHDYLRQGLAAEKTQTVADAVAIFREGIKAYPKADQLHFHLGRLVEKARQWGVALGHYQRVAESHATLPPDVALGMARCYVGLKKVDRALALFNALNNKAPNQNKDVLVGLAACARLRKEFERARQYAGLALALDGDCKEAHHELGEILLEIDPKDKEGKALAEFERNVLREDLHGESLDRWMRLLRDKRRDKYLQDKLEEMSQRYPDRLEFIFGYGVACNRAGEISLARPALERANALMPNNSKILYELGLVERVAGNIGKSREYIRDSLRVNPDQPAAIRTLGTDHKYQYGDEEFKRLNHVCAGLSDLKIDDQIQLHFAQGKAYDDVGELEASFAHYAIGGRKKRAQEPYSDQNNKRMYQVLTKVLNPKVLQNPGQKGFDSDVPVFILGMPRSGTSLMEQILSSHPDIFGAGELKILTGVVENIEVGPSRLRLGAVEEAFPYEQNASYAARGQRYVEQLQRLVPPGSQYQRIVDKMPGNFNFVGLINMILPQAKIIHSRRHPVETCLSCYRIHFAEGHTWTYNLRDLGRYYRYYWNMMKHWREALPGVMLEVRYEENVADVEGQARRLIEYIGLPWNENCLNFHETDRPVKTASASQVRKPIYKSSTNRWRKYEQYLGPLLAEIGDIVEEYEAEIAHLIEK